MRVLIRNGYVVTMNPSREVFDGGYVAVSGQRIEAVGPSGGEPPGPFDRTLEARGMIVTPGLMNLHQHHWYGLFKGLADGLILEPWMETFVLPIARLLTAEDLRAAAYLSALEMIRTGTTCCLNHSVTTTFDQEVEATVVPMGELGFRQVFAKDFRYQTPGNLTHPHSEEEALGFVEGLVSRWDGKFEGRLRLALVLESTAHWVAAGMSTEGLLRAGHDLARRLGLRITNHTSGGTLSLEKGYLKHVRDRGVTDVGYLMRLGLLDDLWLLIHGIHFTENDIELIRRSRAHVVYTPTSEAIRGGGFAPVVSLNRAGVNVALGSDGPMVDYSVDMVEQMKACCFIQNAKHLDAAAVSPEAALEMATLRAARALGMEGELGSLEPGKRADIALFDLRGVHHAVLHKPITSLVCCGKGTDAHTVLIDGEILLEGGRFAKCKDEEALLREAAERGRRIAERAGVASRAAPRWPGR